MTFNQLAYFIAVADCLNFSAAAKSCFTTQPNLSRQIAALESELGHSLFVRNRRQVIITTAGEVFLKHAKIMYGSYQCAKKELENLPGNDTLRFGIMLGVQVLLDAVNHLIASEKFPSIQILHTSGKSYIDNDTVDICFHLMGGEAEAYSMPVLKYKAPVLIPKKKISDSTANFIKRNNCVDIFGT